jgi:SAM-dependent methyltransferase
MSENEKKITQHNKEIHENRIAWSKKKALREAYRDLYLRIVDAVNHSEKGITVELGSGMGNTKVFLPDCITTDLFPNEWIDQTENIYQLSFTSNSVSNLILFDVWHHIEYPADALEEFHRVLQPGGRIIIMEPAMSLTGRIVYGCFHHEPLGFDHEFSEKPSGLDTAAKTRYFAAQSSCHRIFKNLELPNLLTDWKIIQCEQIVSFQYFASGGFRGPQLYPDCFIPVLRLFDKALSFLPSLFAARTCVVIEKKS